LVCSLHQVELALSHFPRIVGLRNGRIVFDAARTKVTDSMISTLYQNADIAQPSDLAVPQQPSFISARC
jgi:phosphonate transport system ATP-binding protein